MTKHRPTIYDIAAAAGVSRQTVTRAMNGMSEISPETRERVLQASARLGYRRSRFATNLVRQHSFTVGFVVNTFRNPYYGELTAEILDAVTAEGWQLAVYSREHLGERALVERIFLEVDAIVGYFYERDDRIVSDAARGIPVVVLDRTATEPGLHSLAFDWRAGIDDLIAGLRQRGSRSFAMLDAADLEHDSQPSVRRKAYESSVDAESASRIVVCDSEPQSLASGAKGLRAVRDRYPEADTVLAFSDVMAMGALQAAHELGIDVPGEMRIVGIDGLSLDTVTSPALSSLWVDRRAIAERVVAMIKALEAGDRGILNESIVPRPLWRGSA